ncbi:MAG: response regulator [Oscillospiraceae bacterium]|nr:response regulator [Oscillospiraceae bacterium]
MDVICVDSDKKSLQNTLSICRDHPAVTDAEGFTDANSSIERLKRKHADIALLSAEMANGSGIDLAVELKNKYPSLTIVFLSKNKGRAFEAYAARPQNYLLKPLDRKSLDREINYYLLSRSDREIQHIEARTFGVFTRMVDGSAVRFKRGKAKELLALLVDRRGNAISRREAFMEMWEDREYDAKGQNYFNVIFDSMRKTLKENGISEMIEIKYGMMRVRPETFDCDLYRYLKGDSEAMASFRGEYLYGYSWAEWNWGY